MIDAATSLSLWELIKHSGKWLSNLSRASAERKLKSRKALRKVVIAARKTAVYMREMKDLGKRSYTTEEKLASLWTELSFDLEDLGLDKLAKRCQIKGRVWADPDTYDVVFLQKADVSLERMEQLANEMLKDIQS